MLGLYWDWTAEEDVRSLIFLMSDWDADSVRTKLQKNCFTARRASPVESNFRVETSTRSDS